MKRSNLIVSKSGKTIIHEELGYPTHVFEVVKEIPTAYTVWPIGVREGLENYIPLCTPQSEENPFKVDTRALLAIKANRAFVKFIMREAVRKEINALRFNELKGKWLSMQ